MSLANDKNSIPMVVLGSNALLNERVKTSGFQNVLANIVHRFASGNQNTVCVFVGEEDPGTDYDTVGKAGDIFIRQQYSSAVPSDVTIYVKTYGGWEHIATHAVAEVTMTAAEILALHTTAKTIVAAPGAGKIIVPGGEILCQLGSQTTGYSAVAAGDDMIFSFNGATTSTSIIGTLETTGYMDQTTTKGALVGLAASVNIPENTAVKALLKGQITTGNMTLKVRFPYTIKSASW
jgi:hypothetical protein